MLHPDPEARPSIHQVMNQVFSRVALSQRHTYIRTYVLHTHTHTHTYICVCVCVHTESERETETEIERVRGCGGDGGRESPGTTKCLYLCLAA
jgi:hypothetical protein